MWTCPKCGREFKRTNQGHYCGKVPENVDEYIELQITEGGAADVRTKSYRSLCTHFAHCA